MNAQIDLGADSRSRDAELVAAVRAGDRRAMEVLMRRHNRMLYRTARAILRDDAAAEDAVQDAYLQAYRALDSFRGDARLSTWLVRIVANVALTRRRQDSRKALVVPLDGAERLAQEGGGEMVDRNGPEREAMRHEVRSLLEARIDALPDLYREVFMLRAVEELSVEETAAALGVSEGAVRTRHFRARSLLRESLARDVDAALGEVFAFDGLRCDRIVRGVLSAIAPAEEWAGASDRDFTEQFGLRARGEIMNTPASIAKHPIHPMLVAIPIGLWLFSLVCDLVFMFGGGNENWSIVARYTLVGGIVGALVAAVPGFIDMLSLPGRLKHLALIHMSINLTVVALQVVSAWLRLRGAGDAGPIWLSAVAVAMLGVSGWLGGKMVYEHGVAVDPEADGVTVDRHHAHL